MFLLSICFSFKTFDPLFKSSNSNFAKLKKDKFVAPLVFWTNNPSYGPIEVFVNDVYKGDITSYYRSNPQCASVGCVTVMISGDNNVWTAQTKDGRRKWASKRVILQAIACNSECLL